MIKQTDVTIIIPHLGESAEAEYALDQCLQSLIGWEGNIIIANNGLSECSHNIKELYISNIFLSDQGQCKAVNAAVATTNTPWVFVTNDDMIYAPGWFEKLVTSTLTEMSCIGVNKELRCISPMLVEPRPGAPTFEVMFAGGAGGDFDKERWLQYAKEYYASEDGELRTGFNLPFLIHRDLWDTVGGYDINYDPWGSNSDSDLEYKIKLAGVQPYQNSNSIVYHFSQTSGTFEPRNNSYLNRNYAYFKEKWGFDRTDNGIWEASFAIPTKEEGRIYCPEWEGKYD